MARIILFILFFVATLETDADAFKFTWPGKANKKAESVYNEARRAYGSADYAKTIELTTRALQEDAKMAAAFALRGKARKDMGEVDAAFQDLNQAIEIDSKLAEAYFIRAQAHEIMGEMEKAGKDYQKGCALGYKLACE